MFQFFDFNNEENYKARATCQFYEDDKQVSLQQIQKDMMHYPKETAFDVFVVSSELFGSNKKFRVTRHEPYHHGKYQKNLNALHINKMFKDEYDVPQWKVKQRLVIGHQCGISVAGDGC